MAPPQTHDGVSDAAPQPRPGDQPSRRRQYRLKTLMLVVALAGIWVWLLRSPAIAGLVIVTLGGFLAGALALGTAVLLGWAGFRVLASCDHLITGAIVSRRKPRPRDEWWS